MTDVYRVGVVLSLKNGVSAGLRMIQGDLGNFMRSVDKANHGLGNMGKHLIAAGAALGAMSAGVLVTWDKIVAKGDEMQRQIAKMQAAGVNPTQVQANVQAAYAASTSMFNVSPQQAMDMISVLRGMLGNSAEARQALVPVLKAEVGLDSAIGGTAASGLMQALKALDITGSLIKNGHMSVAALTENLPYIQQAMILTHGQLTGSDIKRMIQQAGPAATATSFRQLLGDTTEAIMGLGPAVGRGLFMGYKALYAGQVNALQAQTLVGTGMLPADAVKKVKGSFYRIIDTSKIMDDQFLLKNGMLRWLHDKVIPKLQSEGDKGKIALMQMLTRLFPASTSARLMSWVVNNWPQRDRFQNMLDQGVKNGNPYNAAQTTWQGSISNFIKALEGMMTALGQPAIAGATKFLNGITDTIHHMTAWLSAHPDTARQIDKGLLALTAALAAMAVVLAAAGITALVGGTGLFVALAVGVGVLAAAMAALDWKQVSGWISEAIHKIGDALMWFLNPLGKLLNFLSGLALSPISKHMRDQGSGVSNTLNPWAHPGANGGVPVSGSGPTLTDMGKAFVDIMTKKPIPQVPVIHHLGPIPFTVWENVTVPPSAKATAPKGTANDPLHTLSHVTNPGDVHNGTAKALNNQLTGRQNGPSGVDYSFGSLMPAAGF